MFGVIIEPEHAFDMAEIDDLYRSVGWDVYVQDLDQLRRGLANSHLVVTARDEQGHLLGLARTISDDVTICYLRDLLVRPEHQRAGVGRALMDHLTRRYAHCRTFALTTDHESTPDGRVSHAFYRGVGFVPYERARLAGFVLERGRAVDGGVAGPA